MCIAMQWHQPSPTSFFRSGTSGTPSPTILFHISTSVSLLTHKKCAAALHSHALKKRSYVFNVATHYTKHGYDKQSLHSFTNTNPCYIMCSIYIISHSNEKSNNFRKFLLILFCKVLRIRAAPRNIKTLTGASIHCIK